jgi:hypothetical protein
MMGPRKGPIMSLIIGSHDGPMKSPIMGHMMGPS